MIEVILGVFFYALIMKVVSWLLIDVLGMGGFAGLLAMFWPVLLIPILIGFQILQLIWKVLKKIM